MKKFKWVVHASRLIFAITIGCSSTLMALETNKTARNQAIDAQLIQTILDNTVAETGGSGAQLSLQLGKQRVDLVTGTANIELGHPMTVDTVVQIGSTTKLFNAMLIMTLVDEGVLQLDKPVKHYISDFRLNDVTAENTVTLRHLLSMSSGLDNGPYKYHGGGDDALGKYITSLSSLPHIYPPGRAFGYSNAGTAIAGYVAEQVTGQRWDTLLHQRILKPAGLANAGTLDDLFLQRVAIGHSLKTPDKAVTLIRSPWRAPRALAPAGSTLMISARDLASFAQIFLNKGMAPNGKRILSEKAIRTMMSDITKLPSTALIIRHYGVGPVHHQWSDKNFWSHAGGNLGGGSYLRWIPETNGVFSLTTTSVDASAKLRAKLLQRIMPLVFGFNEPIPKASGVLLKITNPERYTGYYDSLYEKYDIEMQEQRLWMIKSVDFPDEGLSEQAVHKTELIPLGGDNFLSTKNGMPWVVGFSGRDKQGRATTLEADFAAKRIHKKN